MSTVNPPAPNRGLLPQIVDDHLQVVMRAWIRWLQGIFRLRAAGDYRWTQNATETQIYIAGFEPDEGEPANKRPRLIVQHAAVQFMGISRDQMQSPQFHGMRTIFTDLVSCPITITCSAREGLEAQYLAWSIFRLIPVFRAQLNKVGHMHHINTNRMQMSPESPHGSFFPGTANPEMKAIQLMIPVTFQETIESNDSDFFPQVVKFMTEIQTASDPANNQTNVETNPETNCN